jgi:cell division septum initiation protein DivIVA
MAKKSIDPQDIKNLEFHSMMLGQIATEVEEFCDTEESTTLDCVLEMKAQLFEAKAQLLRKRKTIQF